MKVQKVCIKHIGNATLELTLKYDTVLGISIIRFRMTQKGISSDIIINLYEKSYNKAMTCVELALEAELFLKEYFNFKVADMEEV